MHTPSFPPRRCSPALAAAPRRCPPSRSPTSRCASSCRTPPARASTRSRARRRTRSARRSAIRSIIDNQPGAGGIVGLQALARSPRRRHDARRRLEQRRHLPERAASRCPFDMPGDFTPIAVVGYTPVVLVVNAKVPAKDAKEFIALLKCERRHELRLGRQRHDPAPGRGDVPRRGRRQGPPHPVQGRRPDADRPDRRPGRLRDRGAAERAAHSEVGRAARHRHRHRAARRRRRRRSRPSSSRACRATSSRPGSR